MRGEAGIVRRKVGKDVGNFRWRRSGDIYAKGGAEEAQQRQHVLLQSTVPYYTMFHVTVFLPVLMLVVIHIRRP